MVGLINWGGRELLSPINKLMKPTSGSRNNVLCSWEQETHDASKETTAGSTVRVFLTCTMREYSKASELSVFMFFLINVCVKACF